MKRAKELSWKPVLNGRTYCSPACGSGCTLAEFELANERGRALAARLGKQWTVRVWENMGWHYAVGHEGLAVHPNYFNGKLYSFTAFLAEGKFAESGKTPRIAVDRVVAVCRQEARRLIYTLKAIGSPL